MGTSQDYRVAAEEGATLVRVGSGLLRAVRICSVPWESDRVWNRALVYFGIVEEDEYWDEEASTRSRSSSAGYRERPNVRRLHRAAREPRSSTTGPIPRRGRPARRAASSPLTRPQSRRSRRSAAASVRVHLVVPRSFNDAQAIADKFKDTVPVILNLQSTDTELSKRLIDFSSGLTYALNGGMQRIADKVFLLTPRNVEVSAEERARMIERGFFNQS